MYRAGSKAKPKDIPTFAPHAGPQWEALNCAGPQNDIYYREIYYGGAKYSGKSFAQILFLLNLAVLRDERGQLKYPEYRGLLIRKNADDLRVLIDDAFKIYKLCGARMVGRPVVFEFPGGPKIFTGHLKDEKSYMDYQGHSYHKIGIDEVNLIPTLKRYLLLLGSLRNSPDGRPVAFLTGNPSGPGDMWVKKRFIKVRMKDGSYSKPKQRLYDPITKQNRIFIPGRIYDNPTGMKNDPNYIGWLMGLPEHSKRALLDGDFDAFEGMAFEEFRPDGPYIDEPACANHVIDANSQEAFLKPYYHRWLSMDWGHTHFGVAYKFGLKPNGQVHVYDEMVVRKQGSTVWGAEIAKWCLKDMEGLPSHRLTLYLSPDAFAKRDEPHTQAEGIAAGIQSILGAGSAFLSAPNEDEKRMAQMDPHLGLRAFQARAESLQQGFGISIERANPNRLAGAEFVRELLRFRPLRPVMDTPDWSYIEILRHSPNHEFLLNQYMEKFRSQPEEVLPKLQIHRQRCPRLIESIQSMVLDPDKPEDLLKRNATDQDMGDDEFESFRMGCMAYKAMKDRPPREIVVGERLEAARARGECDMTALAQIARHAQYDYDREGGAQKPIRLGRMAVPREQRAGLVR